VRPISFQGIVPDTEIALLGSGPQPQVPGYTHTNTGYQSVAIQGNYAYVAASGGDSTGIIGLTLVVYNISNPANPFFVSYITTGTVPWVSGPSYLNGNYKLYPNGNYLYIASTGSSYFYVVNITDPTNPFNISRLLVANTPGSLYGISASGNYVYLATQNKGLTVIDVTNPLVPVQVFQEGGTLNKSIGVYVFGNYVYTTNYQTASPWTVRYLKIWSLANPIVPVLLTTYTLPAGTKPAEVIVYGNTAYVADLNTNSVQIVDVTNPLAPNYLSSMFASATFDVANNILVDGNYGYLTSGSNATYGGAIDLFDITNLSAPVKKKTIQQGVPGSVFGASALANNLLYVANYGVSPSYSATLNIYSTAKFVSPSFSSEFGNVYSVQMSKVGAGSSGGYVMQASLDGKNWNTVPSTIGAIAGTAVYFIPKFNICYPFMQLTYTNTGTGGFTYSIQGTVL